MDNLTTFALYKRVQAKDRDAEDELIRRHKKKYPKNCINRLTRGMDSEYRNNLHTMYLHLT